MPGSRRECEIDNPYYDWSPIVTRPALQWPNGCRVAFAVIVNVEYFEMEPPDDIFVPPSAVRRGPYPKMPDLHETSPHEYGNRVGFFRVADVLDRYGAKGTVALDAAAAERYPYIVDEVKRRGWEFIGHALTSSRMITEKMPEVEERDYIANALKAVRNATGEPVRGWRGLDYGESSRTVRLLAQQGIEYVCDWTNDEQPYRMKVPEGRMVSLPPLLDLDDSYTLRGRSVATGRWQQMIIDAFDRLYRDGAESGRLLLFNLHPWIVGQPYRIRSLDEAVRHIMGHPGVWSATGSEIVDWFLANQAPADR